MPNFAYMAVSFAYHVALAVWIGGALALGALAAPELFRQLPRPQAGGIFGPILRRFSRVRLGAAIVAILAAATKHVLWETHANNVWIAIRWAMLVLLIAVVVYEIAGLEPAMARARENREIFMVLHKRSEALMKLTLMAALVAVFVA